MALAIAQWLLLFLDLSKFLGLLLYGPEILLILHKSDIFTCLRKYLRFELSLKRYKEFYCAVQSLEHFLKFDPYEK